MMILNDDRENRIRVMVELEFAFMLESGRKHGQKEKKVLTLRI